MSLYIARIKPLCCVSVPWAGLVFPLSRLVRDWVPRCHVTHPSWHSWPVTKHWHCWSHVSWLTRIRPELHKLPGLDLLWFNKARPAGEYNSFIARKISLSSWLMMKTFLCNLINAPRHHGRDEGGGEAIFNNFHLSLSPGFVRCCQAHSMWWMI